VPLEQASGGAIRECPDQKPPPTLR